MATTYAEKRLALITAKTRAMNEAMDDEGKVADHLLKEIETEFEKGMKKINKKERKEEREEKEDSALLKEEKELGMPTLTYSASFAFSDAKTAKKWLRSLSDDWVTGEFGHRGANGLRSYHGARDLGAFMIKCKEKGGEAVLYEAEDNDDSLNMPDNAYGCDEAALEGNENDDTDEDFDGVRLHTHMHTHPHTHLHTHVALALHTHMHMHTHTHAHTHAHTHDTHACVCS